MTSSETSVATAMPAMQALIGKTCEVMASQATCSPFFSDETCVGGPDSK